MYSIGGSEINKILPFTIIILLISSFSKILLGDSSDNISYVEDDGDADYNRICTISDKYGNYESSLKLKKSAYELVAFDFYIEFIYNLTYKEEEILPDVILTGYDFQCFRVILFCWDPFGFEIYRLNNKDEREIIEFYDDGLEVYYRGLITEKFIYVLQIIKDYW